MSSISSAVDTPVRRPLRRAHSFYLQPKATAWPHVVSALFGLLALFPIAAVLLFAFSTNRNIAYWDEIDSVLALLLRLEAGLSGSDFVLQIVAVTNEHRTVTSRLLFALSYALTGTVNFVWIGIIGNTFILIATALLVAGVRGPIRRLQVGVVLAFMIYHLGNYENFLWSGSSIDHFQIVTLIAATCLALRRPSRPALGLAAITAILATLTLAHGLVAWPVGTVLLARDRRWRALVAWVAAAAVVAALYFVGFYFNPGHRISAASFQIIVPYWFQVLGAPLAFGNVLLAKWLGALLIALTLGKSLRGDWIRQRETLPMLWFVVSAALLIAIGRAELTGGQVFSRYFILGGIAWALLLFDFLDRSFLARRPRLSLACALPVLTVFNVAQNERYENDAATFIENRDRAALRYRQYNADGHAPLTLHPQPQRATEVLTRAEQRGVYRMPPLCERREFPDAAPSGRLSYFLDEFTLNENATYLAGWVTAPNTKLRRGQLHLVLKSGTAFEVFTTVQVRRPDVVTAFNNPDWELSGFRAAIRRSRLQPGNYQVGFLLADGSAAEFIMTDHWLHLVGPGSVTFSKSE